MKPQINKISAWLALFVLSGCLIYPANAELPSSVRADFTSIGSSSSIHMNCAILTRMVGQVDKWEPAGQGEKLGPRTACQLNEALSEGSIVQTGNAPSKAELKFGAAISRLWNNTRVRIYPGARTVCLNQGAVGFHKDRNCHDEYLVETKRLQARIRGTTIEVHAGKELDEIQVLECHEPVEVWNKISNSRVRLTTGVVLQVRGEIRSEDPRFPAPSSCQPVTQPTAQLPDSILNHNRGELIFWQDKGSKTVKAFTANARAVLQNPIYAGDTSIPPIASIDLIRASMSRVPGSDNLIGNMIEEALNSGKPDKLISKALQIESVPLGSAYWVGPNVGFDKAIRLPNSASTELMQGEKPNLDSLQRKDLSAHMPVAHVMPPVALPHLPGLSTPASDPFAEDKETNN